MSDQKTMPEPPEITIGARVRDRSTGETGAVIDISTWTPVVQDHMVPVRFDDGQELDVSAKLLEIVDDQPPPEEAPDIPAADEQTDAPEPVHQVVQGGASEVAALRERDHKLRELAKAHRDLRMQAADLQAELSGLRQRMKDITQRMEDLAIDQVQTRFLSAGGTVESEAADLFQGQDGDDAGDVDPEAETKRIERADERV